MDREDETSETGTAREVKSGEGIGLGIAFGLLFGTLWGNIALGLSLGILFGAIFEKKRQTGRS